MGQFSMEICPIAGSVPDETQQALLMHGATTFPQSFPDQVCSSAGASPHPRLPRCVPWPALDRFPFQPA